MNMRIRLPFLCSFVGKSWYVLVMSMIRYAVVLTYEAVHGKRVSDCHQWDVKVFFPL